MNFFTIFGTLRAHIQKPFGQLTDRHTDGHTDANRKGRRAHIKCQKGPQGAYKKTKKTAGCCALPNKPRVSTSASWEGRGWGIGKAILVCVALLFAFINIVCNMKNKEW